MLPTPPIITDEYSLYASTPFKFVVDGNPYYIHADLVSHHSSPLSRMINGQMAEAQKGFAVLEDVDEGTFERFTEWAYMGYYKAADFTVETIRSSSPAPSIEPECEVAPWPEEEAPAADAPPAEEPIIDEPSSVSSDDWRTKKTKKKKSKTSSELKESFLHRQYTVRREWINIPPTRSNRFANEDYTEVFLSHARLYVFAEKYDIQPLKQLALEELHSTLAIYTLYRQRTGDIVALLRYAYANTSAPLARSGEDLRTLLRDYIGYEMRVLMKDEEFIELMMEDDGALLRDFLQMVALRID